MEYKDSSESLHVPTKRKRSEISVRREERSENIESNIHPLVDNLEKDLNTQSLLNEIVEEEFEIVNDPKTRKKVKVSIEDWDRCHFYLPRKRRRCHVRPSNGEIYCPVHLAEGLQKQNIMNMKCNHSETIHSEIKGKNDNSVQDSTNKIKENQRIPCPVDPSHTIKASKLKAHLRRCESLKMRKEMESHKYFVLDINTGGSGNSGLTKGLRTEEYATVEPELSTHPTPINYYKDILKAGKLAGFNFDEHVKDIQKIVHPYVEMKLIKEDENIKYSKNGEVVPRRSALRHTQQQVSIIGHLLKEGILDERNIKSALKQNVETEREFVDVNQEVRNTIIEYGAGRGMLGLAIYRVYSELPIQYQYLFIDRSANRMKADGIIRSCQKEDASKGTTGQQFARIRCNIKDMQISDEILEYFHKNISSSSTNNHVSVAKQSEDFALNINRPAILRREEDEISHSYIIVAKHLCGVATDFALKAIWNCQQDRTRRQTLDCPEVLDYEKNCGGVAYHDPVKGLAIASCCHHACNWQDYVGRETLLSLGIGEKEFKFICRCAPWAAHRASGWRESQVINKNNNEQDNLNILEEHNDNENDEFDDNHGIPIDITTNESREKVIDTEVNKIKNILDNTGQREPEWKDSESKMFIDEAVKQVPFEDRNHFGYICKWLIDYGRVKYIQSHLNMKNAKTTRYIEDSISPENHLILASRP